MDIRESFVVPARVDVVWRLISDPYVVVECVPGATLTGRRDDGAYEGNIVVQFGPTSVTFKTAVTLDVDEQARQGRFMSSARDSRGGTRTKATMTFAAIPSEATERTETTVSMDGRVDISGPMAAFVESGATFVVKRIVAEVAARLAERCRREAGVAESPQPPIETGPLEVRAMPWWRRILRSILAKLKAVAS